MVDVCDCGSSCGCNCDSGCTCSKDGCGGGVGEVCVTGVWISDRCSTTTGLGEDCGSSFRTWVCVSDFCTWIWDSDFCSTCGWDSGLCGIGSISSFKGFNNWCWDSNLSSFFGESNEGNNKDGVGETGLASWASREGIIGKLIAVVVVGRFDIKSCDL